MSGTREQHAAAAAAPIGTDTELTGHPHRCACLECRAWRDFRPMYAAYREARRARLWALYLAAFAVPDPAPGAREAFYAEVPMNRHRRRALEARARRITGRAS